MTQEYQQLKFKQMIPTTVFLEAGPVIQEPYWKHVCTYWEPF